MKLLDHRWLLILIAFSLIAFCMIKSSVQSNDMVTVGSSAGQHLPLSSELSGQIDQLVLKTLVQNGSGVAMLVCNNGITVHAKGYGYADIDSKRPIDANTVFDLASVSKQMTGIAILKLVERGLLKLSSPVQEYIPEFRDVYPKRPVTILDLLHHVSGLANFTEEWDESEDDFFQNLNLEGHLQWLNQQKPRRRPGETFEYNNSGYVLLALVIQRVSGQRFSTFMQREIFIPLDMKNTRVFDGYDIQIPNRAIGYAVEKSNRIKHSELSTIVAGDGNVFSSIADLARYDLALRSGQLLSKQLETLTLTPGRLDNGQVIDSDYVTGNRAGYGLGWAIAENFVAHTGEWAGTSAYYVYYTKQPVTIVVLSNQEEYDGIELADRVADLMGL